MTTDNHGKHTSGDHTTPGNHDHGGHGFFERRSTDRAGLGIAGNMAKAFVHSPLSPLLLFASLCLGLLGLVLTPRQEDPQISVPMVDIFVAYPGASASQVASLAIEPLERIMSEITGVKHVYSAAMRGQGMVTVEFDVGQPMGPSIVKVHDKVQSNLNLMPPGVAMPLVKPKGVDDVPVMALTLWSTDVDDSSLRTLALDVLQSLKEVPNTGWNEVIGGRHSEIHVEVLPERLSGFGISLDQVAQTIRSANAEQTAGSSETGGTRYAVTSGSFLHGADDIKRLVVGIRNAVPVYVSDVAKVSDGPQETSQMVSYYTSASHPAGAGVANGAAAVTIAIAKKEGSNGVSVANALLDRLNNLRERIVPSNVHVAITRNYGDTANEKVNELLKKLFIATGAVTILVLMALGVRPAVVVTIIIPVVILLTVFGALMTGYSINRVSLFALIFSIGILVDDAIVVVENIYRRWLEKGENDTETAVDAVREVGNPTILATFTVVAALLPMGFVSGMMGPYMRPIPVLGSLAMVFSLFAAFMFTPWLLMRIKPPLASLRKAEKREHREKEAVSRVYRPFMKALIENRFLGWVTLFSIVGVWFLSVSMFYFNAVPVKMLPFDNKSEFDVIINMPDGTALPNTANVARQMVDVLRKIPEVTALQSYVGVASPFNFNGLVRHYYLRDKSWHADIQVQLMPKGARHRKSHEIAVAARNLLESIAKASGAVLTVAEVPPGPPVLQAIVADIYGPDDHARRGFARDLTKIFAQAARPIPGEMRVVDVDNYLTEPHQVYRFEVDTEKAVRRGISVDTVNRNLAMAMGGEKLGDVKRGKSLEPTYITLQIPLSARADIAHLGDLPIPSSSGTVMPLAELGRFVAVREDSTIFHKDLRAVEYVVGDIAGRLGAPIYGMFAIQDLLNNYTSPDGVKGPSGNYLGPPETSDRTGFEWTGEWTVTYETFRDMGIAFGAALVLIYILVVWEFGNFTLPAIIMAPIPLTLIGIVPGHWLMGAEFTATSMIGFIALAGIIVRNSILLVDFAKHQILAGHPLHESVILASETRLRPIMITALALVAGSCVILSDPIFQGMAVSLLFGVMVSTLLTLVVIPLGCTSAANSFEYPHPAPGLADGGTTQQPSAVQRAATPNTETPRPTTPPTSVATGSPAAPPAPTMALVTTPTTSPPVAIPRPISPPSAKGSFPAFDTPLTVRPHVEVRAKLPGSPPPAENVATEGDVPSPAPEGGGVLLRPDLASRLEPLWRSAPRSSEGSTIPSPSSAEATTVAAPSTAPSVESSPIESPAVESPLVESSAVESPAAESLAIESPSVTATLVESPAVESLAIESPSVTATLIESPAVESLAIESPSVTTTLVESPAVGTPAIGSTAVESLAIESPSVTTTLVTSPAIGSTAVESPLVKPSSVESAAVTPPTVGSSQFGFAPTRPTPFGLSPVRPSAIRSLPIGLLTDKPTPIEPSSVEESQAEGVHESGTAIPPDAEVLPEEMVPTPVPQADEDSVASPAESSTDYMKRRRERPVAKRRGIRLKFTPP